MWWIYLRRLWGRRLCILFGKSTWRAFPLGVRTRGTHCPTHSVDFYVDDKAIPIGMEVMTGAVLDALQRR